MTRSLTEPEIQRYSRQILLREVGGVGQLALLGQSFRLRGRGPALETCAAYVQGAGCHLLPEARPVQADEVGFLFSKAQVDGPMDAAETPSPGGDAPEPGKLPAASAGDAPEPGELGQLPAAFSSQGPRVALGAHEGRAALAWAAAGACARCFETALRALAPASGEASVALGSVGALVALRLVLGVESGVGALALGELGSEALVMERCGGCR